MAPRTERADFLIHSGFPRQLRNQKLWNEVAYLPQQTQFRRRWNDLVVLFHPCRVAGLAKSFQLFLHIPMGWLCHGLAKGIVQYGPKGVKIDIVVSIPQRPNEPSELCCPAGVMIPKENHDPFQSIRDLLRRNVRLITVEIGEAI
ncbi:MAG: hypothetical protein NT154_01575 [Verrucomicrobia bacterium]|nr:hypothetical protein [Verrucomicrobiota bacterium]